MKKISNKLFTVFIYGFTFLTVMLLAFVIYFIIHEALPVFEDVGLAEFLLGQKWLPLDYAADPAYGIFNFIAATVYVSVIAMLLAVIISIGAALFLSCVVSDRSRGILYSLIDLLAGIPSVIYGFIGLAVVIKLFLKLGHPTGSSVLTAAIVLAVMILPFLISSVSDTMLKLKEQHLPASAALGISKWYMAAEIILPLSIKSIFMNMVLAVGRAMGETMAVMMVIGNANLFPTLLGKSETIASLIALEMGTASAGSTHYHALYAAGLVLMLLLMLINLIITVIRKKIIA